VRPNLGFQLRYRKNLESLIDQMHRSITYWISAAYRANEPKIIALAQDVSPAVALRTAMTRLTRYWTKQFDESAQNLGDYFAKDVDKRSSFALKKILKRGGFTVEFRKTPAVNDMLQATVAENVSLIKSIAAKHLTDVEGLVMRSVIQGRDLKTLTDQLEKRYKLTRDRAALIARDQNNKATSMIQRTRQLELGITQARWIHSAGGKAPRPSHVKAGKERVIYDVREGWLDPAIGELIFPGSLVNCRCVAAPVIPGLGG
jgi:uncharacterized protein with gpF-like domain